MLHPGDAFDGYRLIRRIGSGGFGEVWLCRSDTIGDLKALKFVTADRPEMLEKELGSLIRYRQAANDLRSPHLMPIEHINRTADGLFYIMPLADGHGAANPEDPEWVPWTFERMVHERQGAWFSSKDIAELMAPVLDGLQAISGAGLVHRDVKPSNILFLGGRPCLADISLLGEDSGSITRRGTPGYAAPSWYVESGGSPDMFGAATTLYTLLTGNAPDKLGRSRFWWPPQGEASLPPEEHLEWKRLHAVIRRAVEEKPGERFVDFRAFGEALPPPCEGISRPSRPAMPQQDEPQASTTPAGTEPVTAGKVRGRKSCIVGFTLGVLGIFAWFFPLIGFPVTVTGLVLSLHGLRSPTIRLAAAGISLNTIFLAVTIINSALGFFLGWTGRLGN